MIVITFGVVGYLIYINISAKNQPRSTNSINAQPTTNQSQKWLGESAAISGKYADADVLKVEDEKYRLYYSEEPENLDFSGKVYSSISSDGINWIQEAGVRKEMAIFPDVIKLPDNNYRMYFQNAGMIKSTISSDGLVWRDEQGVRVDGKETGFELESVGAPSTIILSDNTYLMVYRGTINQPYGTEKLPNQNTQLFFYATSSDGLNFTKKGIAVDSRNSTLNGLTDGSDLVNWDGEMKLYFWTYTGIYHVAYLNGQFSQEPIFDYTNNTNIKNKFSQNPPADPTLIKISNTWFMYYGQHTKGIYYTVYQ